MVDEPTVEEARYVVAEPDAAIASGDFLGDEDG
jgi:hypothetical protein